MQEEKEKKYYIQIFNRGSWGLSCFIVLMFGLLLWQQGFLLKAGNQQGDLSFAPPLAVEEPVDGLFGSMTITLESYDSLVQAKVLVNGQAAAAFKQKEVTLRVYEGDVLAIDVSAYGQTCSFMISKLSGHINGSYLQMHLSGAGGTNPYRQSGV